MKNILKSVVTIGSLAVVLAGASSAYFTSSAIAVGNIINTGTLGVSLDSGQGDTYVGTWGAPNAYTVVENGVQLSNFLTWDNAAPGDTNSYFVAVRNGETIPFKFRAAATGAWVSGANFTGGSCPVDAASANHSLVQVTNVHQYAVTPAGGCETHIGCRNVRDGLQTGPWTPVAGLSAGNWAGSGFYFGDIAGTGLDNDTPVVIGAGEFAIYRVDVMLSTAADNCYQGATYHFDLAVDGFQEADPVF